MIASITDILISLAQNLSLVIAVFFVFSRFWPRFTPKNSPLQSAVFGLLFGVAICIGMALPVEVSPGIFIDSRAVLVALAMVFGGPITGAFAMVPAILFRLWLGGMGTLPGIGVIATGALLGYLFSRHIRNDPDQPSYGQLTALGFLIAVFCHLWTLTLPAAVRWDVFTHLLPFMGVFSPLATILIGALLKMERQHRATELALARETRLFRQATQSANVGVWEMDYASGHIEYSDNIEKIFGYPEDSVPNTYLGFLEYIFPEDRDAVSSHAKRAIDNDTTASVTFRTHWPDGSVHWYEMSGIIQRDAERKPLHATGVVSDVTKRKSAELALIDSEEKMRASERLFRAIFDQAAVGVAQIDTKTGKFLRINRRYCEIIGYTEEEFAGRSIQEITHPDDLDGNLTELADFVAGTVRNFHLEKRYLRKDGTLVWVNLSVSALWEPGEAPDSHVAIVEDITERKLAEISLRESEALLQESQLIARIGSWEWNFVNDTAWSSEVLYSLLEFNRDTYTPSLREFIEFVHPNDQEHVQTSIQNALEHSSPFDIECRMTTEKGNKLFVMIKGQPVFNPEGQATLYRGVIQDITALRQSEREAQRREERFRKLVESLPVCVHTLDMQGQLSSINSSGLAMMGARDVSCVLGVPYLDVVSDAQKLEIEGLLEQAMAGTPSEFDYVFEFEGVRRYFHSSFVPITDENGVVTEIMGHTVDLTDAKMREMALQELVTAIDHAAESIIISNAAGKVQYVNPAFETLTGYDRDSVIGKSIAQVYFHKDTRALLDEMSAAMLSGKTWKGEIVNYTKSGDLYMEQAAISPVMGLNGELVTIVGVCRDITQERALEKRLLQAQKMEAIGTLAGGIAHDFNNILHFILGNCRLAQDDGIGDPDSLAQYLAEIESGATRASQLVEQILTFSRASDVEFKAVSIAPEINKVLQFLRGSLPASIDLQFEVGADPGAVIGDATQIHQMLANLATNAFHAMEAQGGTLRITLDTVHVDTERQVSTGVLQPGNYALLGVADSGTGIPESQIERLFDPFFTTKSVGKGTGLGLSIIHGIVTRMGGAIEVESVQNEGSTFRLYLPTSSEAAESVEPAPNSKRTNGDGLRVLLVDDEVPITTMMGKILKKLGYVVTIFNNPLDALAAFEAEGPAPDLCDIVICDLTMPHMDGITLCRQIVTLCPALPVLLATGILDGDDADALKAQGIREVLQKPFTIDRITTAIQTYTRRD